MDIKKVTVIGLGLIGGSWAMALKKNKPDVWVSGVDIDADALAKAVAVGAIDRDASDPAAGVEDSDVIVVAAYVSVIPTIVRRIIPHLKPGCIVTDVGSTKKAICDTLGAEMPPGTYFVGGHPMAGSENRGIENADPYLFDGTAYMLTPAADTPPFVLTALQELVGALGAETVIVSPADHDFMVAAVSHLPHIVAAALMNSVGCLADNQQGLLHLAAGGFKDTTRIAASSPEMWQDILLGNREKVLSSVSSFRQALEEIEKAIEKQEREGVYRFLARAKAWRRTIP